MAATTAVRPVALGSAPRPHATQLASVRPTLPQRTPAHRPQHQLASSRLQQRGAVLLAAAKREGVTKGDSASSTDAEPSPFLEPLLRGLVLGVGAGVLCEVLHVAFKLTDIASVGDGWSLPSAAMMYEHLRPLFIWDHVAAVSSWLLFYAIEAAAILAIMRQYPDDSNEATHAIKNTVTLPKRLMPLKLSNVKRALYTFLTGQGATQAAQQGASPLKFRDDGPMPSLPGPRPSGIAGTAVLERPRTEEPRREEVPKPVPKPVPQPGRNVTAERRSSAGLKPGELDPSSPLLRLPGMPGVDVQPQSQSAKRAKELHERKAYLKNFWYAAALSEKISAKPTKVELLSRTVTIWRDEQSGKVHCVDNVCPHRGAPLSAGWTKKANGKSCVVCPYHGWAFDGEGRLQEVPSQEPGTPFPKRPVVDAYPVEERGGFVWLFFGSKTMPAEERPPIPLCPELEDPNWRPVYGELEFGSPHWSVFENALDMAHIHYIHDGSFGNQDNPVIHDMKVTRDTWHVTANFSIHNKPVSPLWNFTAVPSVPVEARAYLPSTSYVKITLANGIQMITFVNTVPIDDKRSINRFCLIRNFALNSAFDGYARKNMYKILGEDKVMIELLKPEQIKAELSLEADKPQIAFRKLRQEWMDMGYGVQPEVPSAHDGSLNVDF